MQLRLMQCSIRRKKEKERERERERERDWIKIHEHTRVAKECYNTLYKLYTAAGIVRKKLPYTYTLPLRLSMNTGQWPSCWDSCRVDDAAFHHAEQTNTEDVTVTCNRLADAASSDVSLSVESSGIEKNRNKLYSALHDSFVMALLKQLFTLFYIYISNWMDIVINTTM